MNRREKILAAVVGTLAVLVIGQFVVKKVATSLSQKSSQLETLQGKFEDLEFQELLIMKAARELKEYEVQSLPSNRAAAKSQYKAWLLELAKDTAGFSDVQLPSGPPRDAQGVYDVYSFKLTAMADRKKLTRFLHKFYEVDFLHRVRDINITPKKKKGSSNNLLVIISIDAIGLRTADAKMVLKERPSNRLAFGSLKSYEEIIVGQDLFGPPNQEPTISNRTRDLEPGKKQFMSLRVSAGEGSQETELEIVSHDFAKENPPKIVDGRVQVFCDKESDHKITLRATDNGLPRKSVVKEFKVSFVKPRVRSAPKEQPKFDESIVAFYTAFIEADDIPSAWISIRTTDKTVVVKVGQPFEIGTIKGKVTRITPELIEYESKGETWTLRSGDNLQQATKATKVTAAKPVGEPLEKEKE